MFELIIKLPKKIALILIVSLYIAMFVGSYAYGQPSFPGIYFLPIILASFLFPARKSFWVVPLSVVACLVLDIDKIKVWDFLIGRSVISTLLFILIFLTGAELKRYVDLLNNKNDMISAINKDIVFAFVRAIDAKDPYLTNHSRNVSMYARQIAECLGLTDEEVNIIYWSGVLHDIGKIGISENILNKKTKLEDEDWKEIKKHPEIGAEIIRRIPSFEDIVPYVLYHHQHYNGGGYPGSLRGEDIPLGARILAVADAFDAMTSDRVYRKGMTIAEAREELLRCAGQQFDPLIVKIFNGCLEKPIPAFIVNEQMPFRKALKHA